MAEPRALSIVIAEDNPDDAELIVQELTRGGYEPTWRRVEDEDAFIAALSLPPDVVIADFQMPQLDPFRALELLSKRRMEIPLVIVSGSIGEEAALEAIRRGVADYVLKDRITRLPLAIQGVLENRKLQEEKEVAERALLQAQKMEAIGQLAGGIAHDFNNLLSVIINYATFVGDADADSDTRQSDLEEVIKAANRGVALVRQLLAFSRQDAAEYQVANLSTLVGDNEKILRQALPEDISLMFRLRSEWNVKMDVGHLTQVLLNLVVNARDAMPHGGTITISTDETTVRKDAEYPPEMTPGRYLHLQVEDTGVGMDEETRARVFEPFFTTKQPGVGTGLGLATVYGIVKQTGGFVYLDSEPGQGTRFQIYLPVCDDPIPISKVGPEPGAGDAGIANATVLVVEDEEAVRALVVRILEKRGFKVLSAISAEDALGLLERIGRSIDLLVTDAVMPGMSGPSLAEVLRFARIDVPVLVMSGYSQELVDARTSMGDSMRLLQKPFTAEELLSAVDERLLARSPDQSREVGPRTLRVLLIDDDAAFRGLLETVLRYEPGIAEIETARCGHDALRIAQDFQPDIAFIDSLDDEMTGEQVAQELKRRLKDILIVALTGSNSGRVWGDRYIAKGDNSLEMIGQTLQTHRVTLSGR